MGPKAVASVGLSTLYEPSPEQPIVDVVFVHGLQGHPKFTWTKHIGHNSTKSEQTAISKRGWRQRLGFGLREANSNEHSVDERSSDVFWPAELLVRDCPNARILTFGYDSAIANFFGDAVSQNNVSAHAKDLLFALTRDRRTCRSRPLVFVAHSLGGIVVKESLRRAEIAEEAELKDFQSSLNAIVFLGTPHRGSGYAQMGDILRRVAAATGMDTNERSVRSLRYNSPELEMAREEFTRQWRQGRFTVKTFQEAKGLKGLQGLNEKVVPDFSSSLDDPRERAEHINANHMEMCKFASQTDAGYVQVGGELRNLVENIFLQKQQLQKVTPSVPEGCLQSLSFSEIDARFLSVFKALDGTCQWLFRQAEYTAWIDLEASRQQSSLLCIRGKPGAGKSTLMKMMIEELESVRHEKGIVVLHFFFNSRSNTRLEVTMLGLLRSLLCQLLQQEKHLLQSFLPFYRRKVCLHGTDWKWHAEELRDRFWNMSMERQRKPLFLIIDALDECDETDLGMVINFIQDLLSASTPGKPAVRVCFSSRHYPIVPLERCLEVHLDKHNKSDIVKYIERWLRPSNAFPGLERLAAEILRRASGVFLWVVLVVNTITKARDEGETVHRMLQMVRDLPKQLNDLIRQILIAIKDDRPEEAVRIMQWVAFSRRAISMKELRFAVEIGGTSNHKSHQQVLTSPTFVPSDDQMEKLIRARTKGLIEIRRYDGGSQGSDDSQTTSTDHVEFIHGSVKEFLLHHQGFAILDGSLGDSPSGESHRYLATTCINHLRYEELPSLTFNTDEGEPLERRTAVKVANPLYKSFPFLEYCVDSMFEHSTRAVLSSTSIPPSEQAMNSIERSFHVWRPLADLNLTRKYVERRGSTTTLGHVAAEYNLANWVTLLIRQGFDVNCIGSRYGTLLQAAAAMGHETLVDQLLEVGADVSIYGQGRFGNALSAAAFSGKTYIIQAILARGADVNIAEGEYGTALHTAAQLSDANEDIVDILLGAGADVNLHPMDCRYYDALQAAAFTGNKSIVKRLLDAGASISARGGEYGSALQAAASQGHEAVVTLLLSKGTDTKSESGDYGSAVMLAASGGHVNIVRQLLALDLAPLIQESELPGQPRTFSEQLEQRIKEAMALAHDVKNFFDALETGDISTMKVILESGLDVNIRGGDFSSAWHAAAIDGKADAMALLLSRPGIEPDMRDWIGRSPLWYAASEGHVRVVQQLLDTGLVDLKAKTANGRNLLWWPCHNGFVDVVRLLLGRGVSAYEEDEDGLSPFMMAKEEKRLAVLKALRMGVADGMEGAGD